MASDMEKISKRAWNKGREEIGIKGAGDGDKTEKNGDVKKKKKKEEKKADDGESDKDSDGDGDGEEDVTFEGKVAFTEKVRRLTNEGLTRLVKKIKEKCKEALEDVDAEKLHI